jgi:xanthine dehydrogenase accessory factor
LIDCQGSSPFQPGAEILFDDVGRIEGSVTGGCIEAALAQEASEILAGDQPIMLRYGISDEATASVGLMCGGTVSVFLHELDAIDADLLERLEDEIAAGRPVVLATKLSGEEAGAKMVVTPENTTGSIGMATLLAQTVIRESRGFLREGRSRLRSYGPGGEATGADVSVFISVFATPPRLVIIGAIDFSAATAEAAATVGYRTTICDARAPFLASARFSSVAETVVEWPEEFLSTVRLGPGDAVLVFTHDPKFDEPALRAAIRSGAGYVGALGSRRTHRNRIKRLRAIGLTDEEIHRIHAPCGLDIGASTPAETAISIVAELVAARAGRIGLSLRETSGPIHRQRFGALHAADERTMDKSSGRA